jgi:hypothetical protein
MTMTHFFRVLGGAVYGVAAAVTGLMALGLIFFASFGFLAQVPGIVIEKKRFGDQLPWAELVRHLGTLGFVHAILAAGFVLLGIFSAAVPRSETRRHVHMAAAFLAAFGVAVTLWVRAATHGIGLTGDDGQTLASPLLPLYIDGVVLVLAVLLMLRDRGARHYSKLHRRASRQR